MRHRKCAAPSFCLAHWPADDHHALWFGRRLAFATTARICPLAPRLQRTWQVIVPMLIPSFGRPVGRWKIAGGPILQAGTLCVSTPKRFVVLILIGQGISYADPDRRQAAEAMFGAQQCSGDATPYRSAADCHAAHRTFGLQQGGVFHEFERWALLVGQNIRADVAAMAAACGPATVLLVRFAPAHLHSDVNPPSVNCRIDRIWRSAHSRQDCWALT